MGALRLRGLANILAAEQRFFVVLAATPGVVWGDNDHVRRLGIGQEYRSPFEMAVILVSTHVPSLV